MAAAGVSATRYWVGACRETTLCALAFRETASSWNLPWFVGYSPVYLGRGWAKKTNREIDQLDNATNMEVQALDILNDS